MGFTKLITEVIEVPKNYSGIVERPDGTIEYLVYGKLHRENGPARILKDGSIQYWVNGKLHREDGPAVEAASGNTYYYILGTNLTKEQFDNLAPKLLA